MSDNRPLDIRRGIFLSASGILILSPGGLLLRLVKDAGLADIVYYRSIFMSVTLALILWFLNKDDWLKPWRNFDRFGALACLLMTVSNIAFVAAIVNTTVANVLVILAAMPLFSALLGWLLIREGVERRTWLAILAAFSGVIVIFAGLTPGRWLARQRARVVHRFITGTDSRRTASGENRCHITGTLRIRIMLRCDLFVFCIAEYGYAT